MINHETLDCYGLHELGSDVHVRRQNQTFIDARGLLLRLHRKLNFEKRMGDNRLLRLKCLGT